MSRWPSGFSQHRHNWNCVLTEGAFMHQVHQSPCLQPHPLNLSHPYCIWKCFHFRFSDYCPHFKFTFFNVQIIMQQKDRGQENLLYFNLFMYNMSVPHKASSAGPPTKPAVGQSPQGMLFWRPAAVTWASWRLHIHIQRGTCRTWEKANEASSFKIKIIQKLAISE